MISVSTNTTTATRTSSGAGATTTTALKEPNSSWLHPSLNSFLPLRLCHNTSCKKVELKRGDFKECSKCRKMLYCGKECQTSNWKIHKSGCQAAAV